ncbi:MAG: hypothetical protein K0R09_1130 [Clostridiales bacterium]|nr:hypothetical protein [Clostridiales bacterium]
MGRDYEKAISTNVINTEVESESEQIVLKAYIYSEYIRG